VGGDERPGRSARRRVVAAADQRFRGAVPTPAQISLDRMRKPHLASVRAPDRSPGTPRRAVLIPGAHPSECKSPAPARRRAPKRRRVSLFWALRRSASRPDTERNRGSAIRAPCRPIILPIIRDPESFGRSSKTAMHDRLGVVRQFRRGPAGAASDQRRRDQRCRGRRRRAVYRADRDRRAERRAGAVGSRQTGAADRNLAVADLGASGATGDAPLPSLDRIERARLSALRSKAAASVRAEKGKRC
jgi:hypothetical protein